MNIVMVGPFGLQPRMTMRMRALPLARALVRRGHAITVLLPPWQNPEDAGRCWDEGVSASKTWPSPRGVPGWFQTRLTAHLAQRVRQLDPDVIHAFKPKAYAGLVHLVLARRYPVVVDTDDWEGPGGWNALGEYSRAFQRFFAWQERWGLTHAGAVTVASRALQTLAWSMGGPPERVAYLPNGIEPQAVEPLRRGEGRPTVLLYTRFFEFNLDRPGVSCTPYALDVPMCGCWSWARVLRVRRHSSSRKHAVQDGTFPTRLQRAVRKPGLQRIRNRRTCGTLASARRRSCLSVSPLLTWQSTPSMTRCSTVPSAR